MNAPVLPHSTALLARDRLSSASRDEMFALFSRHFECVPREQFDHDLDEKDWVIEIRRAGRLLGFSSILVRHIDFDDHPITAIYSGDTIVDPEAWSSPSLARTWIAAVNQLRSASPDRTCYWLLLSSGFRTYRLLPLFWRTFYPRHDAATPGHVQRMLCHLASVQYGAHYDSRTNLVRFPRPQVLRPILRAIPQGRETDPHISFFLAQNRGHASGDELVCITEVSEQNLTAAGRRMIGR